MTVTVLTKPNHPVGEQTNKKSIDHYKNGGRGENGDTFVTGVERPLISNGGVINHGYSGPWLCSS